MTFDLTLDCTIAPTAQARIGRLSAASRSAFQLVLRAMHAAENMAAPDENEYVLLMDAIIAEAMARREYIRHTR